MGQPPGSSGGGRAGAAGTAAVGVPTSRGRDLVQRPAPATGLQQPSNLAGAGAQPVPGRRPPSRPRRRRPPPPSPAAGLPPPSSLPSPAVWSTPCAWACLACARPSGPCRPGAASPLAAVLPLAVADAASAVADGTDCGRERPAKVPRVRAPVMGPRQRAPPLLIYHVSSRQHRPGRGESRRL